MEKIFTVNRKSKDSAAEIKARMIDFLLEKNPSLLIGNEVFFGSNRRAADLVGIDDFVSAYEIKSSEDDVRRLDGQIADYKQVFDFVYVITTQKHANAVKKKLPRCVGLIVYTDFAMRIIRQASQIKKLSKKEILSSIPTSIIQKKFNLNHGMFANAMRKKTCLYSLSSIRSLFKDYLIRKVKKNNEIFRKEKSTPTHFEEVGLLSMPSSVLV